MNKDSEIKDVKSRRVFDSRGNPTIEVDIITKNNTLGRAMAPSGASTGSSEALELRDKDDMYDGKDVKNAINIINEELAPLLINKSCLNQENFDFILNSFDQSVLKSKIGGNVSIALSLANYISASKYMAKPLYEHCSINKKYRIPIPEIQIFGGGAHAGNISSFQDFLIFSPKKNDLLNFYQMTFNIFNTVKKELKKNNLLKGYSDEGGFWPSNLNYIEICEYINNAIKKNNYEIGEDVALSIDVAANELYSDKKYIIHNKEYSVDNLIKTYEKLNQDYNVKLIEDPFFEKDFDSFKKLKKKLIDKSCEIIGDDLTCTNIDLLKNAVNLNSIDGIIIKLNQCGTITETINVIKFCKKNNIKTILSARSGDTEENYLSHLAVGWKTDMIKVGSFSRSERTSKWNELIRIQEQLN